MIKERKSAKGASAEGRVSLDVTCISVKCEYLRVLYTRNNRVSLYTQATIEFYPFQNSLRTFTLGTLASNRSLGRRKKVTCNHIIF
mmetsp:Transcript_24621/g.37430  ORF Transcript_24621/g.37430 Transcript_24621/m.37430 type:complete len:86 (+) Transcript_24621:1331-1588(+)